MSHSNGEELGRIIAGAKQRIIDSARAGELTATQQMLTAWFESIDGTETAIAFADQIQRLHANEERADYAWSQHCYAMKEVVAMILLPIAGDSAPSAVHSAYRSAFLALDSQVRYWLGSAKNLREEAGTELVETAEAQAT